MAIEYRRRAHLGRRHRHDHLTARVERDTLTVEVAEVSRRYSGSLRSWPIMMLLEKAGFEVKEFVLVEKAIAFWRRKHLPLSSSLSTFIRGGSGMAFMLPSLPATVGPGSRSSSPQGPSLILRIAFLQVRLFSARERLIFACINAPEPRYPLRRAVGAGIFMFNILREAPT